MNSLSPEELLILLHGLDKEIDWLSYENRKQIAWMANKDNIPNKARYFHIEDIKRQLLMAQKLRDKLFLDPSGPVL